MERERKDGQQKYAGRHSLVFLPSTSTPTWRRRPTLCFTIVSSPISFLICSSSGMRLFITHPAVGQLLTITVLVMVRLLLPLELVIGIFFVVVVVEVLLSFSLFYLVQYILVLCINKNNSLVLLSTSDAIHSKNSGNSFLLSSLGDVSHHQACK